MTPKEKAKELVAKYIPIADYQCSKQCALICIEEIIDVLFDLDPTTNHKDIIKFKHLIEHHLKYWQEVKTEIEKL